MEMRHGLKDAFDAVTHGELVDHLFGRLVKVDFPRIVALSLRQFNLNDDSKMTQKCKETKARKRKKNVCERQEMV